MNPTSATQSLEQLTEIFAQITATLERAFMIIGEQEKQIAILMAEREELRMAFDRCADDPQGRSGKDGEGMSAHTPGPWQVFEPTRAPGGAHPGVEAQQRTIVLYGTDADDGGVRGATPEEAEANAKLIAAAPALADALKDFVATHGDCRCDECDAANKALRAAGRLP